MAAVIVLAPLLAAAVLALGGGTSTVGTLDFARELRIPPLLEPRTDGAGRKVFDLQMQAGTSELVAGRRTPTRGFNGPQLGPTLRAARRLAPSPRVPATLVQQQMPPRDPRPRVRRFELGDRDINDRRMDMGRIDGVVPVDTTEIWDVRNASGMPHNFHVHDTRFSDFTDPATPYMFHCHLLQHEDRGMMASSSSCSRATVLRGVRSALPRQTGQPHRRARDRRLASPTGAATIGPSAGEPMSCAPRRGPTG